MPCYFEPSIVGLIDWAYRSSYATWSASGRAIMPCEESMTLRGMTDYYCINFWFKHAFMFGFHAVSFPVHAAEYRLVWANCTLVYCNRGPDSHGRTVKFSSSWRLSFHSSCFVPRNFWNPGLQLYMSVMLTARIWDFEGVLYRIPMTDHGLMKRNFHSPVVQYAAHMAQFYVLQHTASWSTSIAVYKPNKRDSKSRTWGLLQA